MKCGINMIWIHCGTFYTIFLAHLMCISIFHRTASFIIVHCTHFALSFCMLRLYSFVVRFASFATMVNILPMKFSSMLNFFLLQLHFELHLSCFIFDRRNFSTQMRILSLQLQWRWWCYRWRWLCVCLFPQYFIQFSNLKTGPDWTGPSQTWSILVKFHCCIWKKSWTLFHISEDGFRSQRMHSALHCVLSVCCRKYFECNFDCALPLLYSIWIALAADVTVTKNKMGHMLLTTGVTKKK